LGQTKVIIDKVGLLMLDNHAHRSKRYFWIRDDAEGKCLSKPSETTLMTRARRYCI